MSADFTAQANRAATDLLAELDIHLPVESYTLLHAIAATAYGKGSMDAVAESAALLKAELQPDASLNDLSDPSNAEVRL